MGHNFDINSYIDVQERINRFWQEYPEGAIRTDLRSPDADFAECRYVAAVYANRTDSAAMATGWAFEIAGQGGMVNSTSHEENCETSAIGRALANLGYATTREDRPSKQEMSKVQRMNEEPRRLEPRERAQVEATHEAIAGGKRIVGPAPRPCTWKEVTTALKVDGWTFSSDEGTTIAKELEGLYDGEQVPSSKDSGGWWPSDIWEFVAAKNAEELAAARLVAAK